MTQAEVDQAPLSSFGRVARHSASGAVWTLFSRITGLVRLVTIGAVLGPTYLGNLFQAANTLPNIIVYELLLGTLIAPLLVPALVRRFDQHDEQGAAEVAGGFLGACLVVVVPVTALLALAGPLVVELLTLGVPDASVRADLGRTGWPLMALLLPQVALYFVAATGAAVQNARGHYAVAAGAPAAENGGVVLVLLLLRHQLDAPAGAQVPLGPVLMLGAGTTAAVALHALVQWEAARRIGVRLVPRAGWRSPEVRVVLRMAVPSLGYAGLSTLRMGAVLVAVSAVQGGVVAFQLALQLAVLPVALFARPIGVALLPGLVRGYGSADRAGVRDDVVRGMRLYALLAVPAALGLAALARPLADVLALGSMGSSLGRTLVWASIASLSLSVWGDGLFVMVTGASYACRDTAGPLRAMALRTGVTVGGLGLAVVAVDGWQLLLAVGLCVSAGDLLSSSALTRRVLRSLPPGREVLLRPLLTTSASSAVVLLPGLGLHVLVARDAPLAGRIGALAVGILVGAVLHLGGQALRRESDVRLLLQGLRDGGVPARRTEGRVGGQGPSSDPSTVAVLRRGDDPSSAKGEAAPTVKASRGTGLGPGTGAGEHVPSSSVTLRPGQRRIRISRTVRVSLAKKRSPGSRDGPEPARSVKNRQQIVVRRSPRPLAPAPDIALALGAAALAVVATAASVVSTGLGVALGVGFMLMLITVRHPPFAAYAYLGLAPLVIGIRRGSVVPLLRPSEALLVLLLGAVGVATVWRALRGRGLGLPRPGRTDAALAVLVVTSSVVPLLWLAARGMPVGLDDALYAVVMAKCVALYVLVRHVVRTAAQVGTCLRVIVATSTVVAVLALAQSLQVPFVFDLLATHYSPGGDASTVDVGRGGSTIGSSIAVGDVLAVCTAVTLTWLVRGQGDRRVVLGLVALFVLGSVGTGQFSALLALGLCVLTVGVLTRTTGRILRLVVPALLVALLAAWPVVQGRLADLAAGRMMPRSWTVRLDNLETYFWPRLFDSHQYLLGVTPEARLPEPRNATGWVWIESGHTWLLWTGGVPLLLAFLVAVGLAIAVTARVARTAVAEVATAAAASCASWVLVMVLTTFDPHMTLRGVSDLLFPLLALSLVPVAHHARAVVPVLPLLPRAAAAVPGGLVAPVQYGLPLLAKRVLDVGAAVCALLLLLPVMLLIALAVVLEDGGPPLYRGRRVGLRGRPFTVLKFRSMRFGVGDALHQQHIRSLSLASTAQVLGSGGGSVKLAADPRVTHVGALLRRFSLDELPQLVNVLAGDMSLVGPRPEVPYALEFYDLDDLARFAVLPGLTGLWQVSGRSRLGQREMLQLDREYAQTWSLRRDCALLLRTPAALLRRDGAM